MNDRTPGIEDSATPETQSTAGAEPGQERDGEAAHGSADAEPGMAAPEAAPRTAASTRSAADDADAAAPGRATEGVKRGRRGPAWTAFLLALVALGLSGWPYWLAWEAGQDVGEWGRWGVAGSGASPDGDLEVRLEARLAALDGQLADLDRRLGSQESTVGQSLESGLAAAARSNERERQGLQDRLDRLAEGQAATHTDVDVLTQTQAELRAGVDALTRADAARERQVENTVAGLRRAFSDLAEEVTAARPPDSRAWRLAEAGYLMRIANQRAQLERDVPGALALLEAADRTLAELDDYGLVPVREALLDAQAALSAQPRVDRVALYLELEALGLRIDAVPRDLPRFDGGRSGVEAGRAADAGDGWWPQLQRRLGGLMDFRVYRDEQVRSLRTPDETFTLHHNLRLRLAQAQLALLRGEQEVWRESLRAASAGAVEHPDSQTFVALARELDALSERSIRASAPDISAPLRRLEAYRARSPREPEA